MVSPRLGFTWGSPGVHLGLAWALGKVFGPVAHFLFVFMCGLGEGMTTLFEPVAAGILVALLNKYMSGKSDPCAACFNVPHEEEDGDCTSSSSAGVLADSGHTHF